MKTEIEKVPESGLAAGARPERAAGRALTPMPEDREIRLGRICAGTGRTYAVVYRMCPDGFWRFRGWGRDEDRGPVGEWSLRWRVRCDAVSFKGSAERCRFCGIGGLGDHPVVIVECRGCHRLSCLDVGEWSGICPCGEAVYENDERPLSDAAKALGL